MTKRTDYYRDASQVRRTKRDKRVRQELEKIVTAALKKVRKMRQGGQHPWLEEDYFARWVIEGLVAYEKTPNAFREISALALFVKHHECWKKIQRMFWDYHFWNFHEVSPTEIVAEESNSAMRKMMSAVFLCGVREWTKEALAVAEPFMDDISHTDD